jgi:PadR family transcriptional regulator, regulatory protein PadR
MDAQLKKGLLESLVLAALMNEDGYGYSLSEKVGAVVEIAETALYPVLRRLEEQGSLTTYPVEHGGRLRKYYRITDSGRAALLAGAGELKELRTVIDRILVEVEGHG